MNESRAAASNTAAPMLVTGMPRSGTSWVGKILDASGRVVYINEPLNPSHPPGRSPGVFRADVRTRFLYVTEENADEFTDPFRQMLELRYHVVDELRRNHSAADLLRLVKYWNSFVRGRLRGRRALVDDPFAVFSANWLARRFGCRVVVVVRHPAAIVSSRKRLGHTIDFGHLLSQPLLVRDWLEPFRGEMEALRRGAPDLVAQGTLLWRMIYFVVSAQLRRGAPFLVVRHEDLAVDPLREYATLYASLDLPFTEKAREAIVRSSTGGRDDRGHAWSISTAGISRTGFRPLDSSVHARAWREQLTPAEIERVRTLTADVAARFYADADWE